MKHLILSLTFLLITNIFYGQVTADFSYVPDTITCTNPFPQVPFTDLSTSASGTIDSWLWDFEDGSTSTEQNPTHIFPALGNYDVCLIACDDNGDCDTICKQISFVQNMILPIADAGPDKVLSCINPVVTLDGSNSSVGSQYTYEWIRDGFILSGTQPMIDVSQPGTYVLIVMDGVNGCSSSDIVVVTADLSTPIINIQPPDDLSCVISSITLDATGSSAGPNYTYQWTGPNIVNGNTLLPTVNIPACYTLIITDTNNGCTVANSVCVGLDTISPIINIIAPDSLCSDEVAQLDASGSVTVGGSTAMWTTTGGNIISGISTLTPLVQDSGVYSLTLIDTSNGCFSTESITIQQDNSSSFKIAHTEVLDVSCYGNNDGSITVYPACGTLPYTYAWSFGPPNNSPSLHNLTAGSYVVTVTDAMGNSAMEFFVVMESPELLINITPPVTNVSCAGDSASVQINVTGGSCTNYTYQWDAPGIDPNKVPPGSYCVTVTDCNGCTAVQCFSVVAPAPLQISFVDYTCPSDTADDGSIDIAVTGGTQPICITGRMVYQHKTS